MKIWVVIIVVGIVISSCERQEPPKPQQEASIQQAETKSGSSLVSEAREKLVQAKEILMQEGKYGCCMKHACDYCALHHSSCDCHEDLKAGKPVCIECYSGWQRGEGAVEKVKKEQVKTNFIEHKH